ncbi:MAG TPA: phosphatidylglycerol lysyltransferase domain-containing protein, partial [Methanomicrobiales archaeon]|nr:phosphatidylglycerol lysyltransferase domain-containing protein [Methanomicrobiales archaeon]
EVLAATLRLAASAGGEAPLVVLDSGSLEWVRSAYPGIALHPRRDFFDYVYSTRDLAELPGRKYLNIRRQVNRFRSRCNYTVDPLTPDIVDEVEEFLLKWCEWRECESHPILAYEKDAILFTLEHFENLGVLGRVIRVDGRILSMALFEELNSEMAVVHFEKGLPECEGIYKAINTETAKALKGTYPCINRESDLGEMGLRESKMRYHPHHFVEVYEVKREEIQRVLR